jgi:hypothetical protein
MQKHGVLRGFCVSGPLRKDDAHKLGSANIFYIVFALTHGALRGFGVSGPLRKDDVHKLGSVNIFLCCFCADTRGFAGLLRVGAPAQG